jgi:hypothetical protein
MTGATIDDLFNAPAESKGKETVGRARSDSDIARDLQAQFDAPAARPSTPTLPPSASAKKVPALDFTNLLGNFKSAAPESKLPANRPRSDSDVARELQNQFDGELKVVPNSKSEASRPRSDSDLARYNEKNNRNS